MNRIYMSSSEESADRYDGKPDDENEVETGYEDNGGNIRAPCKQCYKEAWKRTKRRQKDKKESASNRAWRSGRTGLEIRLCRECIYQSEARIVKQKQKKQRIERYGSLAPDRATRLRIDHEYTDWIMKRPDLTKKLQRDNGKLSPFGDVSKEDQDAITTLANCPKCYRAGLAGFNCQECDKPRVWFTQVSSSTRGPCSRHPKMINPLLISHLAKKKVDLTLKEEYKQKWKRVYNQCIKMDRVPSGNEEGAFEWPKWKEMQSLAWGIEEQDD
jgi:hypothetical protein